MSNIVVELAIPMFFAMFVVVLIHPQLVKIAKSWSIVDRPNARRLNKEPIPVLGGVGMYVSVLLAVAFSFYLNDVSLSYEIFFTATLIFLMGIVDDIYDINAVVKFCIQVIAVSVLIFAGDMRIDNFHGLWGITTLPAWASITLTYITGVGIINAINLMDGVDGLLSGYGIVTASICAVVFLIYGDVEYAVLTLAIVGALIPFFLYNVFGREHKMFMGDSGSLLLGFVFAVIIVKFIQGSAYHTNMKGVVSFVFALFAIPVYDTLRVMINRMIKGRSPFNPDKTHLHHYFISMGFCHLTTTLIILGFNILILAVWFVTEKISLISIDVQFYMVAGFGLLLNIGACLMADYYGKRKQKKHVCREDYDRHETVSVKNGGIING